MNERREKLYGLRRVFIVAMLLAAFVCGALTFQPIRAMADSIIGGFLRDAGYRLAVNCESGCATPIPQPTTTPGSIPKTNPVDASGNSFTASNPLQTNAAQGTAAASSAAWPYFLYGLSGTNQADVDSSHRMLTLASQSGSPWGVSCTPTNCTTKIGNGTNTASVDAQSELAVQLCSVGSCPATGGFTGTDNYAPVQSSLLVSTTLHLVNAGGNLDRARSAPSPAPIGVQAQGYNSTGADAPVLCKQVAIVNSITTATTTLVIAAVTNKKIYICGYHIGGLLTAAGTAKLIYGTQATTPCDTSATAAGAVHELAAASDDLMPLAFANGLAAPISPISSQACVVTTGTFTRFSISVSYEQF